MPTSTYDLIASNVLSSSASSVTFSSIPATYRDLVLVADVKGSGGDVNLFLQFNGDTGSNYSFVQMTGSGSTASSSTNTLAFVISGITASTTDNAIARHAIMDYSATDKHKTVLSRGDSATIAGTFAIATRWANTAAVNSVLAYTSTNNYASGSSFYLYGIAS